MASRLHTLLKRDKEASLRVRYAALKSYTEAYGKISSPSLARLLSATTNRVFKIITISLAILFFALFVSTLFPEYYVAPLLRKFDMSPSPKEMDGYLTIVRIIGILPLLFAVLLL